MTDRELMQMALAALSAMLTHMGMDEDDWNKPTFNQCRKAEAALRERLAQPEQPSVPWSAALEAVWGEPEQKPFGYFQYDPRLDAWVQNREGRPGTPFYTTPPQRKPLTDEEIEVLAKKHNGIYYDCDITFARAIEAKLKEKNNG